MEVEGTIRLKKDSLYIILQFVQVIIEFQLEDGVGTDITLEYTGRYTGHANTTVYPYKYV